MNEQLILRETEDTLGETLSLLNLPDDIKASIESADAVLIPDVGFRENAGPVFPQGTSDFYHFILYTKGDDDAIEIASTDEDYREIALYSADIVALATIVCTPSTLRLIVKMIKSYCERKNSDMVKVKIKVSANKKGKSLEVSYEGPAGQIQESVLGRVSQTFPAYVATADNQDDKKLIEKKNKKKEA
jgi:hypothetical protein